MMSYCNKIIIRLVNQRLKTVVAEGASSSATQLKTNKYEHGVRAVTLAERFCTTCSLLRSHGCRTPYDSNSSHQNGENRSIVLA